MTGKEPHINTQRLYLSPFHRADCENVFAYASNPNVSRFTTWQTHKSIADTISFIEMVLNYEDHEYCWAIRLNGEPAVIGAIEFGLQDERNGDIHYVLAEKHWGKGLMTEAVCVVLGWAFETMPSLERVTTSALTQNVGSTRVMEKCGMKFERKQQEKWAKFDTEVELSIYSITRDNWEDV
jgi:[ribosomal protein S5]-alanine N-acetyltransferase